MKSLSLRAELFHATHGLTDRRTNWQTRRNCYLFL